MNIQSPHLKLLLYKIFKETKINDETASLSLHSLVLQLLDQMLHDTNNSVKKNPLWVTKIKEILHETFSEKLTLTNLSNSLNIHPVHLSRDFPKHFHCGLGHYIRKLKIQKSLSLLSGKNSSLSAITFECGFADQSHFNRCFKDIMGVTPFTYKKLLLS